MTEPTDFDADESPLPGLEPERHVLGLNEAAAARTLAALAAAGLVTETHAVLMEALLTAARQLDRAAGSGKAKDYGVAQLLAQVRETWAQLAPDTSGGGEEDDEFRAMVAELRGIAAEVRDAPRPEPAE